LLSLKDEYSKSGVWRNSRYSKSTAKQRDKKRTVKEGQKPKHNDKKKLWGKWDLSERLSNGEKKEEGEKNLVRMDQTFGQQLLKPGRREQPHSKRVIKRWISPAVEKKGGQIVGRAN